MENTIFDIAVVGAGPAGLSAAINGKIRNKSVIVFSGYEISPGLRKAPRVDNYLGMPGVNGKDMLDSFLKHARELDILIRPEKVDTIYPGDGEFSLMCKTNMYQARTVILAIGIAQARFLAGEQSFLGRGVGYCATCDGPLYKGKRVAIVSEVEEGEEEANFLADICEQVYYIPQYKELKHLRDKVVVLNEQPKAIVGDERVEELQLKHTHLPVDGVFILRKATPPENILEGLELADGAIVVDRTMHTNIKGVFAAGDCTGKPHAVAKAVGQGLVAGLCAVKYLDNQT